MDGYGGKLVGSLGESEDVPALPRDYGNLESWASEDVPALPREDSRVICLGPRLVRASPTAMYARRDMLGQARTCQRCLEARWWGTRASEDLPALPRREVGRG